MLFITGVEGASAPSTLTMCISPDRVVALKKQYERVRNKVSELLTQHEYQLVKTPLASDQVSQEAAADFLKNALKSFEVLQEFRDKMNENIKLLEEAIVEYDLVEEQNSDAFRSTEGIS
ncbi:PE domain-containing protein [Actinosynnema mirum]|uniref:Uncharacterized protein n=1 Tax=Actinosynnema mirum (strain ATCC 29888 / DSM 43827 / JCM 3225 / NBRC 14064 / NCIMB 13271 / NRRL B-12336 / IMRU 3971 / 101) TaxID=446462 RepID=C6WAL8_ACTMD|nr:PE domain-containing protein [Actinosynnema mirum]ACU35485.1 hypothetical protein Amir_1534 [Actinosynnema mirum DSM 43827]